MSEFLKKKITAYFHDPPWKAWVITRNIREGHEKQAIELLKKLGIEIKEIPPEIKAADKLSSTIDRWGRFRTPLQIVISLLIWTYSMKELLNIFDHFTKK